MFFTAICTCGIVGIATAGGGVKLLVIQYPPDGPTAEICFYVSAAFLFFGCVLRAFEQTVKETPPDQTPTKDPFFIDTGSIISTIKSIFRRPLPGEKKDREFSQFLNSPNGSVSHYDFFISYTSLDRSQAQELRSCLQRHSCRVFLDVEDIAPGALWQPALQAALEASHAIVVLVSTRTDDTSYQQEEIVQAIQLTRDKSRAYTVIPVILEKPPLGAVRIPFGLNTRQALDATLPGGLWRVAAELVAWRNAHQIDAN